MRRKRRPTGRAGIAAAVAGAVLAATQTACGTGARDDGDAGTAPTSVQRPPGGPDRDTGTDTGPPTVVDPELGDVESTLDELDAELRQDADTAERE